METKITANFENEILNVLYTKVSFRIIGEGSQARKHTPIYLKKSRAFILEEGLNPLTESFKLDYFIATTNKWMREVFRN